MVKRKEFNLGNLFLGSGRSEKPSGGGWCIEKISDSRDLCSLVSLERQWEAVVWPELGIEAHLQGLRTMAGTWWIWSDKEGTATAGGAAWSRAGEGEIPEFSPPALQSLAIASPWLQFCGFQVPREIWEWNSLEKEWKWIWQQET